MTPVQIIPFNENSLLVSFPGLTMQAAHRFVMLLNGYCHKNCKHWLADLIPAYNSILMLGNCADHVAPLMEAVNHFFSEGSHRGNAG
jgi:hypothetical protein